MRKHKLTGKTESGPLLTGDAMSVRVVAETSKENLMTKLRMALLLLILCSTQIWAKDVAVTVDTPLAPPSWALMERELLRANSIACERFAEKYLDDRGYLLHTPRWGTLDGPDDAIETFYNWTLLHALGGSDSVLQTFKKALEGHFNSTRNSAPR